MKIAWLASKEGFRKSELVAETPAYRKVKVLEGPQTGQEVVLPPHGVPFHGFLPALVAQDERPEGFSFKGRFLPKIDLKKFPNPAQAKALVPEVEPYDFQPHTAHLVDGVNGGDHVLLFGHKGVGKTSLVLQLAARIGQPVIRVNVTRHTTIADFVGTIGINKEGTTFNYGPVITAMRNGYWLLLDEFDFGDPGVMSLFHSVLEKNPRYTLKENDGEVVVSNHGFRAFATGNSVGGEQETYTGTEKINAALLDRFSGHGQIINVRQMTAKQERSVIRARMPEVPYSLIKRATNFAASIRETLVPTFSTRELLNWCSKMILTKSAVEAARITFLPVLGDEKRREEIEKAIGDIVGRRIIIGRTLLPEEPATATLLLDGDPVPPAKPVTPDPAPATTGRTSKQVADPAEIERIWKQYKKNGGNLTFKGIEKDPSNNLRVANGSTAYAICKKYEASKNA